MASQIEERRGDKVFVLIDICAEHELYDPRYCLIDQNMWIN